MISSSKDKIDIVGPRKRPNGEIKAKELPNPNLKIIEEIEGLMSQVNDKLGAFRRRVFYISTEGKLKDNKHHLVAQALEEIDLFQKTTLFELSKAFE